MKIFLNYPGVRGSDYRYLIEGIYQVITDCQIKSFPIDCFAILQHYGFRVYSYEELSNQVPELADMCASCSEDAFTCYDIIAYNDKVIPERVRFSLMHELGHFILHIPSAPGYNEQLADYFSSNLLAPRVAIRHLDCKTPRQIHETFQISYTAAFIALEDMQTGCIWHNRDLSKTIRDYLFSEYYKHLEEEHHRKEQERIAELRQHSYFLNLGADSLDDNQQWYYCKDV